jgi:hypothetical protein
VRSSPACLVFSFLLDQVTPELAIDFLRIGRRAMCCLALAHPMPDLLFRGLHVRSRSAKARDLVKGAGYLDACIDRVAEIYHAFWQKV